MPNDERNLETLPDGALGLIPLESCKARRKGSFLLQF